MQDLTQEKQEEMKSSLWSLFEEQEATIVANEEAFEKIEDDSMELFERKLIAIKNNIVLDEMVNDDDLQNVFLERLEEARKEVLVDVEKKIQEVLEKNGVME